MIGNISHLMPLRQCLVVFNFFPSYWLDPGKKNVSPAKYQIDSSITVSHLETEIIFQISRV